ncbi:uncharacterized protein C1orf21 homolog isoform X1 [Melopsittacus undulatus]|uniref:Uncharacterized protein n=1 Tax=Melopsittacus undulatus TaxID=13146 RepID=A0A8C6NCQ8_MELUD|nr:uncharacterized protein C1orf21 homolog isoform X1 [Melopsittacus undulatus]XP_030902574.2 uncharacterized protein C1orf21 homolog isoform X1 [Melopsittacus undulatus]XP_033919598.1 uncharacterized protein C1orf21 homolog isoform X1 [Melopsittacus undulatus]XP_033919599.1 uncharacterized protein C1orf21 homolog isoform X1 [Melopsittacus undulatus]
MGCASAKHVSTVQNEEETQKGKNYQNGDVFGDEYRIKPVEEVKYMKNGGEDDQKIAARNQENLISELIGLLIGPDKSESWEKEHTRSAWLGPFEWKTSVEQPSIYYVTALLMRARLTKRSINTFQYR